MRKIIIIAVGIVSVLLICYLFFFSNSDESQIRKNLSLIKNLLDKSSGEGLIPALGKAKKVSTFFLDDCRVVVDSPPCQICGSNELAATIHQARNSVSEVTVRFIDVSVSVSDDRATALVTMTATATVHGTSGPWGEVEAHEVEMNWVKVERSWKIKKIRLVETLR